MGLIDVGSQKPLFADGPDDVHLGEIRKPLPRPGTDQVSNDLAKDMVIFIPAGTHHALANKSEIEDFVIITLWPGTPVAGANEVYDLRREAWGPSYQEV